MCTLFFWFIWYVYVIYIYIYIHKLDMKDIRRNDISSISRSKLDPLQAGGFTTGNACAWQPIERTLQTRRAAKPMPSTWWFSVLWKRDHFHKNYQKFIEIHQSRFEDFPSPLRSSSRSAIDRSAQSLPQLSFMQLLSLVRSNTVVKDLGLPSECWGLAYNQLGLSLNETVGVTVMKRLLMLMIIVDEPVD